ncbi:TRAP transporter substrate-binding protein DctP [Marinomonas balearica]|uniref:TRAP-type mannitol/chloroaromatic compound transport system substrate-binding protein n=1 Tax=Marinomonas balearica TaxID=491947 RepID=A0A4R6M998_9GAMM|nr:TRAP transporter substrate-binding protein DctP [Marinomonas balearica]TDO97575.1 TRAP-type mannitol/chloroaromatic compound transport system substrate-binding protein [Marinomonas balearica]
MLHFKNTLVIVFLLLTLSGCHSKKDADIFKWRLQSQAPASSVSFIELQTFCQNIQVMTNGRLIITPFPAGELVRGPDIFNAVSENRIEMGNGWPNWWSAQHPAWSLLNAGPFDLMNLDASMIFFFEENGIELANTISQPKGIIWRPAWWTGMEFGLVSSTPLSNLDDLTGKKIRIGPGIPSEVLTEASGSLAIPLVPEEIKASLENGNLDAAEWTTADGILELGLDEIAPHALVPAIWQPSVLSDFLINQTAYEQLPVDIKTTLETAIKAYTLTTTLKSKAKDIDALISLRRGGMTLRTWNDNDLKRWKKATEKVYSRYTNNDGLSAEIYTEKKAFKDKYVDYYQLFGPYK